MSAAVPNRQLAAVVAESGISRKRLARLVREACAAQGTRSSANHVSVSRWLAGMTPRPDTARALAGVLSGELGRAVTPADIGMAGAVPVPRPSALTAAAVAGARTALQERRAELQRVAADVAAELAYLEAVLSVRQPSAPATAGAA
jgi:hypothetical protein